MRKIQYYKLLTLSIIVLFFVQEANAQLRINSPYSRFGLGDLYQNENGISRSMGGIAYGLRSPFFINSKNPASYTSIDSASFVLDIGYSGKLLQTQTGLSTNYSNYFNLDYIKVAFPVTRWWRASMNLSPYTSVGYNILTTAHVDSVGDVEYSYLGDGGINKFTLGNAFRIGKNFSLGVNSSFLFGNVNYRKVSDIPSNINMYTFRLTNTVHIRQLYFDFGVQYTDTIGKKKEYTYTLGGVFSNKQILNASSSTFAETYLSTESGFKYVKDTILDVNNGNGEVVIPLFYGAGFQFSKLDKWSLGMDFTYQYWKDFSAFGRQDSFANSIALNIGGSYKVGRTYLRAGIRYYDSYLKLNGRQINEIGMTFGATIPLRIDKGFKTYPYIDFGAELGRRGTTADGLIQQNYAKFFIGLTIRSGWFDKIKYQ